MTTQRRRLYQSSNGDFWYLCRSRSGRIVVSYEPNAVSGGQIEVCDFFTVPNGSLRVVFDIDG